MSSRLPHQVRGVGDPAAALAGSPQFERILGLMAEGGFRGFSKAAQLIDRRPEALVQTQLHIR